MRNRILMLLLVTGLASVTMVSLAFADQPRWDKQPLALIVHSTRAIVQMDLHGGGLSTLWKAEYAPMECGGPVPVGKAPEAPWQLVNEAETSGGITEVLIGRQDPGDVVTAPIQVRGLTPDTCYAVLFDASNSDGNAEQLIFLKTFPIETPEVPKNGVVENEQCPIIQVPEFTNHSIRMTAKIEDNGAASKYSFEYALPESGHKPLQGSGAWTAFSAGSGEVSEPPGFANVSGSTVGLAEETIYYLRVGMSNEKGLRHQSPCSESITTGTGKPKAFISVRNVSGVSAHLSGGVVPNGLETHWQFESARSVSDGVCPSTSDPLWTSVSGGSGVISTDQAEATPYGDQVNVGVDLTNLSLSSTYCVRLTVLNSAGSGESAGNVGFETEGPPSDVSTFTVHRLVGSQFELFGTVNPKAVSSSEEQSIVVSGASAGQFTLTFAGQTTVPIAFDAPATSTSGSGSVESALRALGLPIQVEGLDGGPYTVFFGGVDAGSAEPLIEADGSGLTSGSVAVTETAKGGESSNTQFWFQYVTDKQFEETGWLAASETVHTSTNTGKEAHVVGLEVPELKGGETYRFRLLAESNLSGGSPTVGGEQSLTVPVPPTTNSAGLCPNEAFRTGLSAKLSDCRAYEQVTPVEKGAAQEPFHYKVGIDSAVLVGEDGEHAALEAPEVIYGSGARSGQSPYLFSREEGEGGSGSWGLLAGDSQPEAGINNITPQVYSAGLTQIAFESAYAPSQLSESSEIEYRVGPLGGPYQRVVSVPRADVEGTGRATGWVAGNGDFSKLVLASLDHELLGRQTGTREGADLYEYSNGGVLQQLNVTSEGATIGSCGAIMVNGEEGSNPAASNSKVNRGLDPNHFDSSSHSVSVDGSRVFFEAVLGGNCSETKHLFMRVDGAKTIDIGIYRFLAANAQGTRLVLIKPDSGGEVVGYDTETETIEAPGARESSEEQELEALGIPVRAEPTADDTFARPRYTFWTPPTGVFGQASRYDSVEHTFECISCASSFDPMPRYPAYLGDAQGLPELNGGAPNFEASSRDGDFAFFTTVSRLVSLDEDGEFVPEPGVPGSEFVPVAGHASQSTDVYEWRAAGIDGCNALQGCLSLITDGSGGYLNLFLGTAHEGRDVFFYTRSVLSSLGHGQEGSIGEGNIYDAREDGGSLPPPPRLVECEAGKCATAPNPPADLTPSSLTFSGNGNVVSEPSASPKSKKKVAPKKKKKKKARARKRKREHTKARRSARRGGRSVVR